MASVSFHIANLLEKVSAHYRQKIAYIRSVAHTVAVGGCYYNYYCPWGRVKHVKICKAIKDAIVRP